MRRFAAGFDDAPAGFDLDLADTARSLGLGDRSGRQSPFRRTLARCVAFQMARREGPATLAVRRRIPPMPRRHLQRLPTSLQSRHAQWLVPARSSPVLEEARRNARRLALALLASGNGRPEVELQLVRWHVHPAIAHEATQWAWAYRAHETAEARQQRTAGGVPAGRPAARADAAPTDPHERRQTPPNADERGRQPMPKTTDPVVSRTPRGVVTSPGGLACIPTGFDSPRRRKSEMERSRGARSL